jgi:hypothetical protein
MSPIAIVDMAVLPPRGEAGTQMEVDYEMSERVLDALDDPLDGLALMALFERHDAHDDLLANGACLSIGPAEIAERMAQRWKLGDYEPEGKYTYYKRYTRPEEASAEHVVEFLARMREAGIVFTRKDGTVITRL